MTSYGSSFLNTKKGMFTIEIQSVNRRFLESTVFLPKDFSGLEIDIKKAISKKVFRGQVTCRLIYSFSEEEVLDFLPNIPLLKNLQKKWEAVAFELNIDKKNIDINFLLDQVKLLPKINKVKDITEDKEVILKCLDNALLQFIDMKEKEGQSLEKDIEERLKKIEVLLVEIKDNSKDATKELEEKLNNRLADYLTEELKTDERILREIAIYAEKLDITEELIRLNSHIKQFFIIMKTTIYNDGIGRKLDFLLQEMGREINTIGSKASNKDISKVVVDIKSELEKIREQVQNIE
jgi:uncharacterized protein (TIGR00255 family)